GHPCAVRRAAQGRNRLPVPGATPAREARLAEIRMGRQRGEPAREVLPADGGWEGAADARAGSVVADRGCDRTHHEPRAGGEGVARVRRRVPDIDDLDAEIRGHLAISIQQRIDRGEDPASARLAALKEFGNLTLTRDSMRSVWRHRWLDSAEALG